MSTADLIDDAGAAASGSEFFRSEQFLAAEGVTHTLRIAAGDADLLTPLIVREIPGADELDAISPYGYPGFEAAPGTSVDPAAVDWSATGLVSVFIRHRLGDSPLAAVSARGEVQIADPALPPKSRPSDRQQIRKNLSNGYELEVIPGSETTPEQRAGFLAAYEQTMRRADADQRYFFSAAYFDSILAFPASWLVLAVEPRGAIAAASIATRSDGMLHYYLSGTADEHRRDSPMKNVVARMTDLAAEFELPLNLGGGIRPGDPLEEFKRGFANRSEPFHTSEIVCDPAAYGRLSAGREATGFFPAYRS